MLTLSIKVLFTAICSVITVNANKYCILVYYLVLQVYICFISEQYLILTGQKKLAQL